MLRGYRSILIAFAGLTILAVGFVGGLALQPEEPNLTSNAGYQPIESNYHPGGSDCEPAKLKEIASDGERAKKAISCQESAEQHRITSNDLIQQRRSADAANAMAVLAYKQTGIAAWGVTLGFVTMAAAIFAAFYARSAAVHSDRSHEAFVEAERAILHAVDGQVGISDRDGEEVVCVNFINRGRASGRVTKMGSKPKLEDAEFSAADRWITIPAGETASVAAFSPPPRNKRMRAECWIEYQTIGPKTHTSHFTVDLFWRNGDRYGVIPVIPGWVVTTSNPNGHPDDT